MDDTNISTGFIPDMPKQKKTASPYELLMRQSRKMGGVASRSLNLTRSFLNPKESEAAYVAQASQPNVTNSVDKQPYTHGTMESPSDRSSDSASKDRKKHDKEMKAMNRIVKRSHQILAHTKTVPMLTNIFPDSITVDRTKVTITKRTFFWSSQVITTRIEDILGVTSNFGPMFGSLTISTRVMNSTDHYEVNFLWRKDAVYLKEIIQGYVIAQHNKITTRHLSKSELVDTLLELGRDSTL